MFYNEDIYRQTLSFVAKAHAFQKIPGMELPYLMHIAAVTMETLSALQHTSEREWDIDFALQCALLHDVIEDTPVSYKEVEASFGHNVAQGVLALTKNEQLSREQQMMDSLQRILQQPDEIRVVKMCDRIDNLHSAPIYWTTLKRKKYQSEGQLILDTLGGVCTYAEARLQNKIALYSHYL